MVNLLLLLYQDILFLMFLIFNNSEMCSFWHCNKAAGCDLVLKSITAI